MRLLNTNSPEKTNTHHTFFRIFQSFFINCIQSVYNCSCSYILKRNIRGQISSITTFILFQKKHTFPTKIESAGGTSPLEINKHTYSFINKQQKQLASCGHSGLDEFERLVKCLASSFQCHSKIIHARCFEHAVAFLGLLMEKSTPAASNTLSTALN